MERTTMSNNQTSPERPRSKSDRAPDPTPEEIAARCLEIQMRWSEEERIGRTNPESTQVDETQN